MRTADPQNTQTDFVAALKDVRTTFTSSEASNIPNPSKKLVAEYSFLAAAILFESFLSDLVVAYISADSKRFRAYLQKQMSISTSHEHATRAKSLAAITISHPTTTQIRLILDSRDFNVTFETVADMKACAGKWLSKKDKKCFHALSKPEAAVLSAMKRVRNFLAHRNDSSNDRMQAALANADLPTDLRRGKHKINDVASFLQAQAKPNTKSRLELYLDRLEAIALTLCP